MMTMTFVNRLWVPVLLFGGLIHTASLPCAGAQAVQPPSSPRAQTAPAPNSSLTQSLLDKARAFEERGRIDMSAQTWQQVLLTDPNNAEALAGLARAARLSGDSVLANTYLDRLRAVNPNDPNIARVNNLGSQQNQAAQLRQAAKLAQSGQYGAAMVIYREVFGTTPPLGDWALAYYETEAATADGRAHAVAALRSLTERFPADPRYQIALGRVLTYNAKTREEGRTYLSRFPNDAQATDALRHALLWDASNPAIAPEIRAFLAAHDDPQLTQALAAMGTQAAQHTASSAPSPAVTSMRARSAAEIAAYGSLNAGHVDEAEERFKAILAADPNDTPAVAGMGYVRMQQGNFTGAVSYLEQARHDDPNDAALAAALDTARFWFIMGEGQLALEQNDLTTAEKRYRAALGLRPNSMEALEGLGGTLLKAQEPAPAVPLFERVVEGEPSDAEAWRGLFLAQYENGHAAFALATDQRIPVAAHNQLMGDPLFLRALAAAYSAVGRDRDAQTVLASALELPFPTDAKGMKADTQIQYAGLLFEADHLEQAAGLYRQVIAQDHTNVAAWQGLVQADHAMGHDAEALESIQSMPPTTYAAAMRDPGFLSIVASVNQTQKKLDVAQGLLQKAIAQQTSAGQKPSLGLELQLAGVYMERDSPKLAYPIYRQALNDNPNLAEAWAGLLAAEHQTGSDKDAAGENIPAAARVRLQDNVGYLRSMASIYGALGRSREAALYLARAEQDFAAQNRLPPVDVEIQQAWLLYNGLDDPALYRQLMGLGSRSDLTAEQRRTVQTIWAEWAVRRANQDTAAGDNGRALAILNAAAQTFPDNIAVLKALASGYAAANQPQQAIAIYKKGTFVPTGVGDFQVVITAALAADDQKDAEHWITLALAKYPNDPQVLILGAKIEQARGNTPKAIDDYRASLREMPPPAHGSITPLAKPMPPMAASGLPGTGPAQDLYILLAPDASSLASSGAVYGSLRSNVQVPAIQPGVAAPSVVPPFMTNPTPAPDAGGKGRLKDYVSPQSRLNQGAVRRPSQIEAQFAVHQAVAQALNRKATSPAPAMTTTPTAAPSAPIVAIAFDVLTPEAYQQQQVARLTEQVLAESPDLSNVAFGPFVPYVAPILHSPASGASVSPIPGAVAVQLGDSTPHPAPPQTELTDVLPTEHYTRNSRPVRGAASHPNVGGHAPDVPISATTQDALYATDVQRPSRLQVGHPTAPPTGQAGWVPDSGTQQYPQPRTMSRSSGEAANTAPSRTVRRETASTTTPTAPAAAPIPAPAAARPMGPTAVDPGYPGGYPGAFSAGAAGYPGTTSQSLTGQPYPLIGPPYPMGTPPSDAELDARVQLLPALLGRAAGQAPMGSRQEAESQLATLEGSYSGWAGGTGIGRYRGGNPGLDRFYDLETPVELSATLGQSVRLTFIPSGVSLNSGRIDPATFSGQSSPPYLGTMAASTAQPPAEQVANGVGGELQLATRNFGVSAGYTPYEFPVQNIIGSFRWRPFGGHLLLFGDRAPVRDTQLSYAGLHDPGTITSSFPGKVWGGVVSTTGGFRMDFAGADGRSGLYLSADGGILHGYHVLNNAKFEGSAGVYRHVHTWPGYGSLTIWAALFGMHYEFDEVGLTYGQGGYFSPNYYFLASLPVTFNGSVGSKFHYVISGAAGAQSFQQSWEFYFPLDPILQFGFVPVSGVPCTSAQVAVHTCNEYPVNSLTSANYTINSEASYRFGDHWYLGGFVSGNNTNNYNAISGGFFFRYAFRRQHASEDYPTGLFPVEGQRSLRIP
jgi:tetratricopeptide (TPR) repeat protein